MLIIQISTCISTLHLQVIYSAITKHHVNKEHITNLVCVCVCVGRQERILEAVAPLHPPPLPHRLSMIHPRKKPYSSLRGPY